MGAAGLLGVACTIALGYLTNLGRKRSRQSGGVYDYSNNFMIPWVQRVDWVGAEECKTQWVTFNVARGMVVVGAVGRKCGLNIPESSFERMRSMLAEACGVSREDLLPRQMRRPPQNDPTAQLYTYVFDMTPSVLIGFKKYLASNNVRKVVRKLDMPGLKRHLHRPSGAIFNKQLSRTSSHH